MTIPGIAAVNSWGGPTKEFQVEVDPHKLEAYSVTVPQVLTALGNANLNVGGREIRMGQQSINIRGVGLINDGGNDDLRQGYKVDDIENVVLAQANGVPVLVRDVAKVSVGYRPRLGILGRDQQDDVVGSIVVMRRTEKTADMIPKVKAAIDNLNHDGSLPPGVRVVPYYDRPRRTSPNETARSSFIRLALKAQCSAVLARVDPSRSRCILKKFAMSVTRSGIPVNSSILG